jgi:hypothetical protein
MTALREKMIKAMELRNFAKNTQRGYLTAVKGLASHYHQSPDKLTKDQIEDYLLYLKNGKGNTTGSCGAVAAGLRFFYNSSHALSLTGWGTMDKTLITSLYLSPPLRFNRSGAEVGTFSKEDSLDFEGFLPFNSLGVFPSTL